jgi:hypothetical protein
VKRWEKPMLIYCVGADGARRWIRALIIELARNDAQCEIFRELVDKVFWEG